jgi:ribosomal protein S18 acetylase RimI-like enzyme
MIDVVPLAGEHLDALHSLYLALTAPAPHCALIPGWTRFAAGLRAPRPGTRLFVAWEDGAAHGFAAAGPLSPEQNGGAPRHGITALFFGDDAAGVALLGACEQALRADGARVIEAFPASRGLCPVTSFNGGWDGLPDRLPAIARLLTRQGYLPIHRELHMTLDLALFQPHPSAMPPGIALACQDDVLSARAETQEAGTCEYGTLAALADAPEAAQVGYIWWLGVSESFRRRGVARALLTAALADLQARGCRACWLTTAADNWTAQALYLALGFEVVDDSASFRKTRGRAPRRG